MASEPTRGRLGRAFLADYGPFLLAGLALSLAAVGITLAVVGDPERLRAWLDTYGFLALFLVLILEGAMLLYFAPSESLVPVAVTLLADSTFGYAVVILTAVAGATVGQYALFLLAKRGGREYLLQKPWFRVSESALDRFDSWFDRWGRAVVPASNALLFTRGMVTVPAGLAEMRDAEFVALSALGSLIFQTWLALVALYGLQYLPDWVPV
ncbi:DedA family protein [Halorientalis litorea]|jgi:membrane protein DedA with SNARE-associated domain|uniref:DedA family protein n=1 Tax=Halorientalis litorea TaxID=2931977 RepID=UPI001FF552B5|nr:VTT domain-containing protein [Halorientalis litorea]